VPHPSSAGSSAGSPVGRRAVLAAVPLALLALTTGCEDAVETTDGQTSGDPDQGLLDTVTNGTLELFEAVTLAGSGAGSGRTAAALTALGACLGVHLGELVPGRGADATVAPTASPAPDAAPGDQVTPRSVLLRGRAHVTLLVDAASRAESGDFARLLASASAGVQQHLVALERRSTSSEKKATQP
jgi:hypothetical protein